MLPEQPHVAEHGSRLRRWLRRLVGVGLALDDLWRQRIRFILRKAGELEVEPKLPKLPEFEGEELGVPLGELGHAVDRDAERLHLRVGQVVGEDDRNLGEPELACGLQPEVTCSLRPNER